MPPNPFFGQAISLSPTVTVQASTIATAQEATAVTAPMRLLAKSPRRASRSTSKAAPRGGTIRGMATWGGATSRITEGEREKGWRGPATTNAWKGGNEALFSMLLSKLLDRLLGQLSIRNQSHGALVLWSRLGRLKKEQDYGDGFTRAGSAIACTAGFDGLYEWYEG